MEHVLYRLAKTVGIYDELEVIDRLVSLLLVEGVEDGPGRVDEF